MRRQSSSFGPEFPFSGDILAALGAGLANDKFFHFHLFHIFSDHPMLSYFPVYRGRVMKSGDMYRERSRVKEWPDFGEGSENGDEMKRRTNLWSSFRRGTEVARTQVS